MDLTPPQDQYIYTSYKALHHRQQWQKQEVIHKDHLSSAKLLQCDHRVGEEMKGTVEVSNGKEKQH